jgi:hypothetical protein
MKYATEVGTGAMIYIPIFMMTDSGNQKIMGGGGGTNIMVFAKSIP